MVANPASRADRAEASPMHTHTTNILLSRQQGDTGAASSLIGFTIGVFGVIGMNVIMLPWPTYIFGIGAIMLVCAALSATFWAHLLHSPKTRIPELEK